VLKHQFVEFDNESAPLVEPVFDRELVEACRRARELKAWRFRFFARRWHDDGGSGGWSDPVEHSGWYYVAGDVADPDDHDIPDGVLDELKDRVEQGTHTILLRSPDGNWKFAPEGSTIMFDQ